MNWQSVTTQSYYRFEEDPLDPALRELWRTLRDGSDDPLLRQCRPDMRRVTYGLTEGCDVRAEDVEDMGEDGIRLTVRHALGAFEARIPAFGGHMVYATLAAAAVLRGNWT